MYKIVLIILIIPLFFSLLRPGFFSMQDDLQAFRIHQMFECFKDLQIPCRWVPDMGYKYGYPQFNYYPPGVYYLGAFFHLFGVQIIDAVKIIFILGFLFSSLSMFLLLRSIFGNLPALVGSLLYSYAPFKAVQVYVRGSLSEFWAFVFFPLVFWSSYQLIRSGKTKYMLFLSLSLSGLLLTHNLMSFIFIPIFLIWLIYWLWAEKKWNIFLKILGGILLGFGLSAFFVLPLIFERGYVHLETLLGGYFDWRQHFVSLKQLFLSNHFGYGSSYLGPNDDLSLSLGIVHWIVALFALILSVLTFKSNKKISVLTFLIFGVGLFSIFLMHQKSSFIWEKISILAYLQFPWRFLVISTFLLSFLGGGAIYLVSKIKGGKVSLLLSIATALGVFLLHANFFQPKDWFNISDKEKFSGESWEKQLTISIFDYLPIYAKLPPNQKAPDVPEVLEGDVKFLSYRKGSNYQYGEIEAKRDSKVRLPLFDFPGMQVWVDGKKVVHWNNDCRNQEYCLGLITFKVPQGKHRIKAQLKNTPIRSFGNIISLTTIFLIILLSIKKYEFKTNY